jgi:hypothetical protein
MPPGRQCAETDDDERALGTYMDAIDLAQSMDRDSAGHLAREQFATARIAGQVIAALMRVREFTVSRVTNDECVI